MTWALMVSIQRGDEEDRKTEVVILDGENVLSYPTPPPIYTNDKDANLSLRGSMI